MSQNFGVLLFICAIAGASSSQGRADQANPAPPAESTTLSTADAKRFVQEYYEAFARGNVATMVGKFADRVRYEEQERDRAFIEKDLRTYIARWSVRTFEPHNINVSVQEDGSALVSFNLVYTVTKQEDKKTVSGHSANTWIVRAVDGAFQITSQREVVHADPKPSTAGSISAATHEDDQALSDDELGKEPDTQIEIPTAKVRPAAPTPRNRAHKSPADFIIALDIGHTPSRGGAVSARGVFEYEFNRRLVGELFTQLQEIGFTRSFIINPQGGNISLARRSAEANAQEADLFLAIHHDSVKDRFLKTWEVNGATHKYCDDFHGYSIFVSNKNAKSADSLLFASKLGQGLVDAGFTPTLHHVAQENRPIIDKGKGIYSFDDLVVLKTAKMPAVLLECGIIVNRSEEEKLNSAAYRKRLIDAVGRAIQSFASR